jgi:uncharacterized repeat protein (TIGR03843 family)
LWAIDHGVSFHHENKLRTVLWDLAGSPVPANLVTDIGFLAQRLTMREGALRLLDTLLSPEEWAALQRRVERLLAKGKYPQPTSERSYPWPPV